MGNSDIFLEILGSQSSFWKYEIKGRERWLDHKPLQRPFSL